MLGLVSYYYDYYYSNHYSLTTVCSGMEEDGIGQGGIGWDRMG